MSDTLARAICVAAVATLFAQASVAQETLKVAMGQRGNWDTSMPELGQRAGIFKKHGLILDILYTQGGGETQQAVISGSVDVGGSAGIMGVLSAYAKGAPVRIIGAEMTGAADLFWYVRADSPIRSLSDANDKTIAYSTNGASTHAIVLAFIKQYDLKAKPVATGNPPSTLTQVMSGQVDIGWGAPPFGLKEIKEGKIRIIAHGSDVPSLRDQTVRVTIANAEALKNRKEAIVRFVQAYREAVDWMYSDPKAIELYAKKMNASEDLIKESVAKYQPKAALQTDTMSDLPGIMRDAVKLKYLKEPLTQAQLAEFIQIPPRAK